MIKKSKSAVIAPTREAIFEHKTLKNFSLSLFHWYYKRNSKTLSTRAGNALIKVMSLARKLWGYNFTEKFNRTRYEVLLSRPCNRI